MEYQNIIYLLRRNQPSKYRTKNWIEINDDSHWTYNTNSQVKFKTSMLKSNVCDYIDAFTLVKGNTTVTEVGADDATRATDRSNKQYLKIVCHLPTA